jgi:hypothetical protein
VKRSKHPRFRTHTRKSKSGKVWVWYAYDMRPEGGTEISLGADYDQAIAKWRELYEDKPKTIGLVQEAINQYRAEVLPTKKGNTLTDYTKYLARVEAAFGKAGWHQITVPVMREYLRKRSAKTQANRELSMLSILWGDARKWGMTELRWPAEGLKNWKNAEQAREFEVTGEMFAAVYRAADSVLRDVLDVATATGLRLTDVRRIIAPVDGRLAFKANKTAKPSYFIVAESVALTRVLARRNPKATSITFIVTERGLPLSERMLRERYDLAREVAADTAEKADDDELAASIRKMWLKDTRKFAADLAEDEEAAAKLLQHSSVSLTRKHYRSKGTKLKPVR